MLERVRGATRCCADRFPCSRSFATGRRLPRSALTILSSASARPRPCSTTRAKESASTASGPGAAFTIVDPPSQAWMVAGGVGLAPFAVLAQSLRARGVASTLFYGARRAEELFLSRLLSAISASSSC